ncbi:MAG: ATP-binding cassette domain-containing protein [Streptosporangiales bacterium]|nr:ATP-binding cassette domain-containing protein [Streptosporangiales bacterium]
MTENVSSTAPQPPLIEVDHVSKTYVRDGQLTVAVDDANFSVPAGSVLALVGPSGCGKTTLLNMIAGLLQPTKGSVRYAGSEVTSVNCGAGYMTQHDTLLPWRRVLANVSLPLEIQGLDRRVMLDRAADALREVGLQGFERHFPNQLSGGMRKRVQLARTLVYSPETLLMDEPFGSLDAILKINLQQDLLRLLAKRERDLTVVLVTHDLEEAVTLADTVLVMAGRPARVVHVEQLEDLDRRTRDEGVVALRRLPEFSLHVERLWQSLEAASGSAQPRDGDGRSAAAPALESGRAR